MKVLTGIVLLVAAFFIAAILLTVFRKRNFLEKVAQDIRRQEIFNRQVAECEETVTKRWADILRKHKILPNSPPNQAVESDREELVYAVCTVWRDERVIREVAQRVPHVLQGWVS